MPRFPFRLSLPRLALVLAAAGSAALPAAAQAAFPGRDGRIAFAATPQACIAAIDPGACEGSDLFSINPNGTALRRLTGGAEPAYSPDGRRIAFAVPDGSIFVAGADGRRAVRVTRGRADTAPTWSPGGTKLAFVRGGQIYTIDADGDRLRALTTAGGDHPTWAPTGDVAFERNGDIYLINSSGLNTRRLTTRGGSAPSWAPGGRTLAFIRGGGVHVVNRDRSGLRQLTRRGSDSPAFSPSGRQIAFEGGNARDRQVYAMTAGGRNIRRVAAGFDPDWQPLR